MKDLENKVEVLVGRATACWDNLDGAGQFESSKAKEVVDDLMVLIQQEITKAQLTKQGEKK